MLILAYKPSAKSLGVVDEYSFEVMVNGKKASNAEVLSRAKEVNIDFVFMVYGFVVLILIVGLLAIFVPHNRNCVQSTIAQR